MIEGPSNHGTAAQVFGAEGANAALRDSKVSLKKGETFVARVDRVLSGSMALISAKGASFLASTGVPLREGGAYSLRVEAVRPCIVLKTVQVPSDPVPGAPEILARASSVKDRFLEILSALARSHPGGALGEDLGPDLRRLQALLQTLAYQRPDRADGKWMVRALMGSGIFWEQKILRQAVQNGKGGSPFPLHHEDLKGLLTKVLGALEEKGTPEEGASSMLGKAREALSFIEDQQRLNLHAGENGWYWFLPGSRDMGFYHAEFFGRRSPEPGEHRLHVVMAFSHLGQMEADLTLSQGGLTAVLRMEDRRKALFVSDHIQDLEQGLRNVGIRISAVQCDIIEGGLVADLVLGWGSRSIDVLV